MHRPSNLGFVLMVAAACPSSVDAPPPERETPGTAAPTATGSAPAEASPPLGSPPKALPAVRVTAPEGECPPLLALPTNAPERHTKLVGLVTAIRQATCQPELFALDEAEVRETIGVPAGTEFEVGRRHLSFGSSEPVPVSDLLAVMGVSEANMTANAGWRTRWVVQLEPWGPGRVRLDLGGERNDPTPHGTVKPIPDDATISDEIVVFMPPEVVAFADDPHAASTLVDVLAAMGRDPALLDREANEAQDLFPQLGERFGLARYSVGSGDAKRTGFSVRPRRTELVASELAKAFGLDGATHDQVPITDANRDRLSHHGRTEIPWKGLELEIELQERDGGGAGLEAWVVDDMQVLPLPAG